MCKFSKSTLHAKNDWPKVIPMVLLWSMKLRELNIEKLPKPKNTHQFLLSQKYSLEIGAGVGLHAIRFAQENPDFTHIAIERTTNKALKMKGRSESHQLNNLIVHQDDAINWVSHNCPNQCLDKVFLLYPNPNPKNKAARWIHMPFFKILVDKMKTGASLFLATNMDFYQKEFLEHYQNYSIQLKNQSRIQKDSLDSSYRPLTHFEKKYLARAETCYHLEFIKT